MIDPPRPECKDAVSIFKKAGITTIMITGDHKTTALAIAKELGIAQDISQAMSGEELDKLSFEELKEVVKTVRVFARVSPENKMSIVKAIKDNIKKVIQDGKNIYICSKTCGNAKTSWAVKLMLKYFDQTWENSFDYTRGLYVHVPTLFSDMKHFDDIPEYISRIKDADVVIWDDIAFAKLSEYEYAQLLQLIDNRLANGKSNIYTSNVTTEKELSGFVGHRLSSRIYNTSKVIVFMAGDFRVGGKIEK